MLINISPPIKSAAAKTNIIIPSGLLRISFKFFFAICFVSPLEKEINNGIEN